jgi:hypothetical protein
MLQHAGPNHYMDLLTLSLFRLFAVIEKIQFSERHQWNILIDWHMGNCLLEDAYVQHLQSGYVPQGPTMAAGRAFKEHSQAFLPEMNPLGNREMAVPRSLMAFPKGGQMHNVGRFFW